MKKNFDSSAVQKTQMDSPVPDKKQNAFLKLVPDTAGTKNLSRKIKVALFCGGRGNSNLIREFLRNSTVELTLLINAYDDGLSTGALRRNIPGMLGPSDFRKNLSHLLEFYSSGQYALAELFEYRLDKNISEQSVVALKAFSKKKLPLEKFPIAGVKDLFQKLSPHSLKSVQLYLSWYFDYLEKNAKTFNFADCAVGNLVFAGAFLKSGSSFNAAVIELASVFETRASLVNVTNGESRTLVALKENGDFLNCEEKIVSKQVPSKLVDLYLLETPLSPEQEEQLKNLDLSAKREFLKTLESPVSISAACQSALQNADVIVYGSGTQHSSLLPSYKTKGIVEAIRQSKASAKIFLVNILEDHDIHGWTATELIDGCLRYLGDEHNQQKLITDVLYNRESEHRPNGVHPGKLEAEKSHYKGAHFRFESLTHPLFDSTHCGNKLAFQILRLVDQTDTGTKKKLTIYVDLRSRNAGTNQLVDEFLDIDWRTHFSSVRLILKQKEEIKKELPDYLSIGNDPSSDPFSEVTLVKNWLNQKTSDYLVTLVGDGIFQIKDTLYAVGLAEQGGFGIVLGSRTQSKKQQAQSIRAVYGDSAVIRFFANLASTLFSLVFWGRSGLLFSDPLTGFRLYNYQEMHEVKGDPGNWKTPLSIVTSLLRHSIEIAEIPVSYYNLKGFTELKPRIERTLRNLIECLH